MSQTSNFLNHGEKAPGYCCPKCEARAYVLAAGGNPHGKCPGKKKPKKKG